MEPPSGPAPLRHGMIFVRNGRVLGIMVRSAAILAGLLVVALAMPVQPSLGAGRTLDLAVYPDGSAHVSAEHDVDPLEPSFELGLFGSSVDNFVAVDGTESLLSYELAGDRAVIDTFGSPVVVVDYDIHDLVSKQGRVWTFSLDSPVPYSLLMPPNSIIVGLDALPTNMEVRGEQTRLELGGGLTEVNYIFAAAPAPAPEPEQESGTLQLVGAGVGIAMVAAGVALAMRKRARAAPQDAAPAPAAATIPAQPQGPLDPEAIFALRPDMRDDDKELVRFIYGNGGSAMEKELRKRFLQPRTTMWRAVKRLERQGVIEIVKKDTQNLVKLKSEVKEQ